MLQSVDQHLGNFIGTLLEYDAKNNVGIGTRYMRIKVCIDEPLKRGKMIKKASSKVKLDKLKYESLWVFCNICGIIGHSNRSYEMLINMGQKTKVAQKKNYLPK